MVVLDIVCIGILVADTIAHTVNHLPERGKLQQVDIIELFSGGCAANAAIDMSKLGLKVSLIGKIGDDGFGYYIKNTLQKANVDITGLTIDKVNGTSASIVTVDSSGERTFLHYTGANASFTEEDISYNLIQSTDMVFVAGSFLMPQFDGEPCAAFLKKAKAMCKYTALDTAWDATGRWMKVLKPCMEYIDLFMPSYEEAVNLSGKTDPKDIADVFIEMGVKTVVIKLGSKGCFINDIRGEKHILPAFTQEKVVDTTGAGDAFCAGFLTGMSLGWSLQDCGVYANAVGAHCVMAVGSTAGITSFKEISDFIKDKDRGM